MLPPARYKRLKSERRSGAARRYSGASALLLAAVLLAAVALVLAACGGNGDDASPTPSPITPTPPPSTPMALRTPDPDAAFQARILFDLASDAPLSTVLGAAQGALRSDLPGLAAGDFNGDGVTDILLGARFADGPDGDREDAGEAYIIFGGADLPETVDLMAGDQDVTIYGPGPGGNLGFSAAAADLNNDGIDDIILGTPFIESPVDGTSRAGVVHIFFGRPDLPPSIDLARAQADVTLVGPGPNSFFGDDLAVGDVNGDGLADLIVGATFARNPEATTIAGGSAFVFFGRQDWPATLDTARGQHDAAIHGAEDLDEVGDTVAVGDVNGDGIDDIIMTAEAADGPGNARPTAAEVYVLFGSAGFGGDYFVAGGDHDVTIYGAADQDTLGFDLAAADVNGDGVGDVIMGARGVALPHDPQNRVGAVYLLLGGPDLPPVIDLAEAHPSVLALFGADSSDTTAHVAAGDLSGDGRAELLIGAVGGDGPGNARREAGEVYVLDSDSLEGLDGASIISAVPLAAIVYGQAEQDRMGNAIAVADVTGDGRAELLVLSADADGPGPAREGVGKLYVISLSLD